MFKGLRKYLSRFGISTAILVVVAALVAIGQDRNIANHDHSLELQRNFSRMEHRLVKFTRDVTAALETGNTDRLDELFPSTAPFYLHVFRNDSLIYWNTNKMPVYAIAELHFPFEGLFNLQNGWYFSDMSKTGSYKIVGSFLIQRIYPYENAQLHNEINPLLTSARGIVLPDHIPSKDIYCRHEKPLFSFQEVQDEKDLNTSSTALFCGFILLALLLWLQLNQWFRQRYAAPAIALVFILLRLAAYNYGWTAFFKPSSLFDPSILAMSELTPNLGELLLSFTAFLITINALIRYIQHPIKPGRLPATVSFAGVLLILPLGLWLSLTGQQMVENSSIPFQLDQIFELDRYSLIVLAVIGVAGYSYILFAGQLMKAFIRTGWPKKYLLLNFALGIAISIVAFSGINALSWSAVMWTILLTGIVLFVTTVNDGKWNFSFVLFALFLFSISTSVNIKHFAGIKEQQERELYANQLADEKDINTEIEYVSAKEKLLNDPYLLRFKNKVDRPQAAELKEALERRVFNGYWERYDIDFFYFSPDSALSRFNGKRLGDFETLLKRHGERTDVDSTLYFVKDYTSQYTYIFRTELKSDSLDVILFGTLKSKKIPEEIGFPRLLISDKAKVFESLGSYSIAKYYDNKLVFKYGDYSYPVDIDAFPQIGSKDKVFFNRDGYNHYFLRKTGRDFIILSKPNTGWLDGVTAVAFLFVTYGFFLALFMLFESRVTFRGFNRLSLAVKIQVVLVGLVFTALLAFGIGSGTFVRTQYEEYTSDLIREKLHSIAVVSRLRLGDLDSIDQTSGFDLAYHLQNWSNIFVTDVNIFNLDGQLTGSSRPKIYNIGLLSEQMNPDALKALVKSKKSEYIHQESIGKLHYLSAYIPFTNNEGKLLAYINLQHFDQQNEFESQIQRFLVAIINVFMLLLALSIVSAVFISSWLTSPLRMIRSSFSRMELGKSNMPILYTSKDEIGDLVREYNKKLAELDVAAFNLAQSERESAWREMAKQVAHEIKNPLTPMKLSIQHLLRIYDPNDPAAGEKLERVARSVIEQIDALTTIANAFSNFAKMPQPKMEVIDMKELIGNAAALFSHDRFGKITLNVPENIYTEGDREMLLRVMNNIITNAFQAIPPNATGVIGIDATTHADTVIITVTDNGSGISEDKVQTIFEPYFTTKSTGTGLGLAMVRQIIEGHKGTIRVKSTSFEGTVMEITLPLYRN